jgi:adenylate cyclase
MSKGKQIIIGYCITWLIGMLPGVGFAQNKTSLNKDSLQVALGKTTDENTKADLQIELGRAYVVKAAHEQAIDYFKKALPYKLRKGDTDALMKITYNLGVCYLALRDVNHSLLYFEQAKEYGLQINAGQQLARIYNNLVSVYNSMGNMAKVLENTMQLLKLGEKLSDPKITALAYYQLGYVYHFNGDYDKAFQNYKQALAKYETARDTPMIASLQINIGEYYLSKKQVDSAALYFNKSLKSFTILNNKEKLAALYERLGSLYALQNDYDNILKLSEKSNALARELGNQGLMSFYAFQEQAYKMAKLYTSYTSKGDKPEVPADQKEALGNMIKSMEQQIAVYREHVMNYREIARMYQTLAAAKEWNKDYEGALADLKKYTTYTDSFDNAENRSQFASIESKYAFEKSRDSLQFAEEQKRLGLQKEMALNALKAEYDKKRALAKTEEERKQLLFEEAIKRKEIESTFLQKQNETRARFEKEKALSDAEQDKKDALAKAELERSNNMRNMSFAGAGLLLLLAGGATWAYTQKRKDNRLIAAEKKRSDKLLLNILPEEVAEELKRDGQSQARRYDEVSVLFTDFVNFTTVSEQLQPEELIAELNICFTAFDHILERHQLEKIKTIGDAYLAVGGLPVAYPGHAVHTVRAAVDIIRFIEKRKQEASYSLDIRIGIHSGPLVAGIIGVKKFAYDIWGDTVNTASRLESSSEAGKVNISEATYQLVKDEFSCTYRGKIAAKNKGAMDMYFVEEKPGSMQPL